MLKKLELIIRQRGLIRVAIELDYKSTATISKWLKDKRIPPIATNKVKSYVQEALSVR